MFIAAIFTIAKIWKHPKCASTDDWIKMCMYLCVYVHTETQWNTIQPQKEQNFAICGNVDGLRIMLNEVSQRKYDLIYMWNLKNTAN